MTSRGVPPQAPVPWRPRRRDRQRSRSPYTSRRIRRGNPAGRGRATACGGRRAAVQAAWTMTSRRGRWPRLDGADELGLSPGCRPEVGCPSAASTTASQGQPSRRAIRFTSGRRRRGSPRQRPGQGVEPWPADVGHDLERRSRASPHRMRPHVHVEEPARPGPGTRSGSPSVKSLVAGADSDDQVGVRGQTSWPRSSPLAPIPPRYRCVVPGHGHRHQPGSSRNRDPGRIDTRTVARASSRRGVEHTPAGHDEWALSRADRRDRPRQGAAGSGTGPPDDTTRARPEGTPRARRTPRPGRPRAGRWSRRRSPPGPVRTRIAPSPAIDTELLRPTAPGRRSDDNGRKASLTSSPRGRSGCSSCWSTGSATPGREGVAGSSSAGRRFVVASAAPVRRLVEPGPTTR